MIVGGGELDIHFGLLALGGFVLDPEIREWDFAVYHGEPVVCGNLLALLLLLGLGQGFELGEPWVDGFFELEVEDDPR